jgi:MinD superfamily P-loop ATPase
VRGTPAGEAPAAEAAASKRLPVFDQNCCSGCGACVKACPERCVTLVWSFGTLARPDLCTSCDACAAACPERSVRMDWVPFGGNRAVGKWREGREG